MRVHELWNELGNLYFISGSYGHAVYAYERAIELSPNIGEPYSNLALTYVKRNEHLKALDYYNRSLEFLTDGFNKAVSMHKLGEVYLHLKRFQEASDLYQKMQESTPDAEWKIDNMEPSELLLHCSPGSVDDQQIEKASDPIVEASSELEMPLFVEELTPWWFEGQVEPDDEPESSFDLENTNVSGVYDIEAEITETEPLIWEQEYSGQSDHEEESFEDEPSNVNEEAAIQDDEAVELDAVPETDLSIVTDDGSDVMTEIPEFSGENITNLDTIHYETSSVEYPLVELSEDDCLEVQAEIDQLKQKLDADPSNAPAWHTLGGDYKALSQYDDAIDAYQKAIELDPKNAQYLHHLGLIYAAVSRYEDAISAFEKVVEVDPNHSLAHATLGGYYRKNGNQELATEHIDKARELLAKDENEYNRACMEAICGNTNYSLKLLELALKNKQAYVSWARRDPDLDFIRSDPRFHALLEEYTVKSA